MSYRGNTFPIPLGGQGLMTDAPMNMIPMNFAIKANNVSLYASKVEKSKGSTRYNSQVLDGTVVGVHDWWPVPTSQRLIALTSSGKCYRDTGDGTFSSGAAIATGLGILTPDVCMVEGGNEVAGNNKKLFVFTGTSQVQMLSGDGSALISLAAISTTQSLAQVPSGTVITSGAIYTTTTNSGFTVSAARKFNAVAFTVTQAATGSPVYIYEYWNGAAFTTLTLTTTPVWSSTGAKVLAFTPPADWAAAGGVYTIRSKATTAPTLAVNVSGITLSASDTYNAAADWASSYPTFGILHNNRLWAFGNANGRHFLYGSTISDHGDFTGTGSQVFNVYPGEGDGLVSAVVFRGILYLFKRPGGIYFLNDTDPTPANWQIQKYSDAFGVSSPHGVVQALQDIIIANSTGSYTSLSATDKFGDLESGDVLASSKIEEYYRSISNKLGIPYTHAIYYPEKKTMYFTFRSTGSTSNDRMLVVDSNGGQIKHTIETKDAAACLGLRKDNNGIPRPIYGDYSGYVYLMDQATYNVNGAAYIGEFQTPHMDFSILDPKLSGMEKLYDFLSVTYDPTGAWNFFVDVYIDGVFSETLLLSQAIGAALDTFVLDTDTLGGDSTKTMRLPLHGSGNRISFRIYNNQLNQNFKVEQLVVNFRPGKEYASI